MLQTQGVKGDGFERQSNAPSDGPERAPRHSASLSQPRAIDRSSTGNLWQGFETEPEMVRVGKKAVWVELGGLVGSVHWVVL